MTNREFFEAIVNGTMNEEIQAYALGAIEKMDNANAKRAAKIGEKSAEAYAPFVEAFVGALGHGAAEAKTASTILPVFDGMETPSGKVPSVQFVSAVARKALAAGLCVKGEVKVKGKGAQVGYYIAE